jgi:hypothetical protein
VQQLIAPAAGHAQHPACAQQAALHQRRCWRLYGTTAVRLDSCSGGPGPLVRATVQHVVHTCTCTQSCAQSQHTRAGSCGAARFSTPSQLMLLLRCDKHIQLECARRRLLLQHACICYSCYRALRTEQQLSTCRLQRQKHC